MKTYTIFFLFAINCVYGQTKMDVIVNASETGDLTAFRAENKDTTGFYSMAIRAYNHSKYYGYAILASHGGTGVGLYANSLSGKGIIGVVGHSLYLVTNVSGSHQSAGVLGVGNENRIGVEGYSGSGIGGYFSSNEGNVGLVSMNNVGIKTKTPAYPLAFSDETGDKISFSGGVTNNTTNHFGIGIRTSQFQVYTPTVNDDILFGIGRSAAFTEKVRIKGTGAVGIGVSNPDGLLDVNGRIRVRHNGFTSGVWMSNSTNSVSGADGAFYGLKADTEAGIWIGNNWRFWVNNVGNGTFTGTVSGVSFVNTSDVRFKKNIVPLKNSFSDLMQIKGVRYDWKKDEFPERNFSDKNQIGFIAQEIEKIFPEMVFTDTKGYKSVDYARLTPVLVEAIKELIAKNNTLESRLDKIELSLFSSNEKPTDK